MGRFVVSDYNGGKKSCKRIYAQLYTRVEKGSKKNDDAT